MEKNLKNKTVNDHPKVEICSNCNCSKGSVTVEQAQQIKLSGITSGLQSFSFGDYQVEFLDCLEICKDGEHFSN